MGVTPARLRTWILILGGTLIAAIAIFLLYGRWQGRRLGHDIPEGLSTTIQQSTEGFTHSESRGGHTIYTLHASKAVQFKKDGHAELHDVSITLYDAKGAPANRIYGNSFDWDPVSGIARALGEVQIDFQESPAAPAAEPAKQGNKAPADDSENRNTVHVKTSGLVFNKQTGMANTPEKIEFRLAEAAGSATGASFNSQTGVVILAADVAFASSVNGNPLQVRAHHAQFDRDSRLLYLLQEVTDYADSHGSSDQATVSFRPDGSAYEMEAQGNVVLSGSDGQLIHTRKVHFDLGPKSEPQQALVNGGLLYTSDLAARLLHGSASSATLLFGQQTSIRHVQLRDAVSLVDEEKYPALTRSTGKTKQNPPQSTSRQLQGSKIDIDFATGADRKPVAQKILATGSVRLNVHEIYAKTPPQDTTVEGDQLFATLTGGEVLSSLRGTGHTSLVVVSPSGAKQSSTGDNLLLSFTTAPGSATKAPDAAPQPAAQLESALQSGNVTLTQETPPRDGGAGLSSTTATADQATYEAATQTVHLSGNPRIKDPNGELSASAIEVERATGNARATGGVKATYRQGGRQSVSFAGTGPIHVIADHAQLDRDKDLTMFYGTARDQARLWQGSDSLSAPIVELSRVKGTLSAHGESGAASAVNAVFTSSSSGSKSVAPPATPEATTPGATQGPATPARAAGTSVVRLQSKAFLYAENDHKAVFTGGVSAQTPNGTLHANGMDIYFTTPGGTNTPDPQGNQPGSQISRIVAHGSVLLQQPGRKGTGEQLNYTAQDGKFVLTGTSSTPPRLVDEVRGTVTGAALIFNDRDDSVTVDGGASKAVTQTHVAR
jgi:lipopolysaccharide export system protein LptA